MSQCHVIRTLPALCLKATCFGLDIDHHLAKNMQSLKGRYKTVASHTKHDDVLYIAFFKCLLMVVYLLAIGWSISRPKHVAFK